MSTYREFLTNVRTAPHALRIFGAFVAILVVSVAALEVTSLLGSEAAARLDRSLTAYGLGATWRSVYIFSLIVLIFLLARRLAISRLALVLIMCIGVVTGLREYFSALGGVDAESLLATRPWRLLATVLLPAVWIGVLLSPGVTAFCLDDRRQRATPVPSFLTNLKSAPPELLVFAAFVTVASLGHIVLRGVTALASDVGGELSRRIAEYGGEAWVGYVAAVLGSILLIQHRRSRFRIFLIAAMGANIVLGVMLYIGRRSYAEEIPSLVASPGSLAWSVVIPTLWIAVLLSPRISAYCLDRRRDSQPPGEAGGAS